MTEPRRAPVLVVGVGNELRGDDAVGILAVRRLADRAAGLPLDLEEEQNDAAGLPARWRGRRAVVLVDAVAGRPGTIHRFDASHRPLPLGMRRSISSHAVSLDQAIELDRTLGNLPPRVIVYAAGGQHFDAGANLSDEVATALPELAERILTEALGLADAESPTP